MKKLVFTAVFAAMTFIGAKAQEISFDKKNVDATTKDVVVNYGTVTKGADGTRTLEVTNKGKKPLLISSVSSTCGCTVPSFSKDPILPGKTGKITIKYDTTRVGVISKQIEVISNDPKKGRQVIKIKGEVK